MPARSAAGSPGWNSPTRPRRVGLGGQRVRPAGDGRARCGQGPPQAQGGPFRRDAPGRAQDGALPRPGRKGGVRRDPHLPRTGLHRLRQARRGLLSGRAQARPRRPIGVSRQGDVGRAVGRDRQGRRWLRSCHGRARKRRGGDRRRGLRGRRRRIAQDLRALARGAGVPSRGPTAGQGARAPLRRISRRRPRGAAPDARRARPRVAHHGAPRRVQGAAAEHPQRKPDHRKRAAERRHAAPERAGAEDQRLGSHPRRAHPHKRHLRHELPLHARAESVFRLPLTRSRSCSRSPAYSTSGSNAQAGCKGGSSWGGFRNPPLRGVLVFVDDAA